jgi:aryl-alcohol dehydrogenase-like predicted oxidoreductase
MKTKKLGFSDLHLSALGLGTWAMGGGGYECGLGFQDDKESIRTIHEALEKGINWIDTAPMYGLGHAEEVIGKAVREVRKHVTVATKCGILWDQDKRFRYSLRKDSLRSEVEASLRRLQTEQIDLLHIHLPVPDEELEEGWHCISELIREGKIRYGGVSNFTLEQIQRLQPIHPIASIQPVYNMFSRQIEHGIMDYCTGNAIGIVTYSPLCSGLISGGFSRERLRGFHADDFRPRLPDFQDPLLGIHLNALGRLKPVAERMGFTLPQLAIAWVLRRRELTSAIVGARCSGHINEITEAVNGTFTEAQLEEIELILAEHSEEIRETGSPGFFKVISRVLKLLIPRLFAAPAFTGRKAVEAG